MTDPTRANGFGGVIPVGRLHPLVMAALGRGVVAGEWRRYLEMLGKANADEGERRLYPLVASRIDQTALDAAERAPLRSQRRAAMVRHEILFAAAAQIETLLGAARPVLLKGLALQVRLYRERAVRASSDVDIFVPPTEIARTLAQVEQAGWMRTEARPRTCDVDAIAATQTRLTYRMPSGVEVDVHWYPRQVLVFDPAAVEQFTSEVRELDYRGRRWRIPSDTWLLFEAIEHGLTWNQVTPTRWLTDAVDLLEAEDAAVDWQALVTMADRARLGLVFAAALKVMAGYCGQVPEAAIERLEARRAGMRERIYLRCRLKPPLAPLHGLLLSGSHLLLRGRGSVWRRIANWPGYYRASALKCVSWADVAARAAEKIRHRGSRIRD
jgi:hypothetical protein